MPLTSLSDLCGWIPPDPQEADTFEATLETPAFSASPAFGSGFGADTDRLLWTACQKDDVFAGNLPSHNQQQVGDCVSHAFASALEYLQCVELARGDKGLLFNFVATEFIYGVARLDIAHGKFNRAGDGVDGLSAANALIQVGSVPRAVYPSVDLSTYSPQRARTWGNDARALPNALRLAAAKNRLSASNVSRVRSYDEAAAAIRSGYPVTVCSFQGFTMQRDATGRCTPTGYGWERGQDPRRSGHCMVFIGVRGGEQPGLCCLNSWPASLYSGTTPDDMPATAFWVDEPIAKLMLAGSADWIAARGGNAGIPIVSDCWAVSLFGGFASRLLDSSF